MSCRIDYTKNSVSEIRDMVENKKYGLPTFADQTQEESAVKLDLYRNIVTTKPIDNDTLKQGYHLDSSGKTMRYVWVDTDKVAFQYRSTDRGKQNFVKKKGRQTAEKLSNTPDNILKRELGTALHSLAENIMKYYISTIDDSVIDKSPYKDFKLVTAEDIKSLVQNDKYLKDYFVYTGKDKSPTLNAFSSAVKEIIQEAIKTQKNIDPNGKVKIYTEQFIFDAKKSLGGTLDLLVLYSDNTADIYDYKSVHVDNPKVLDEFGNINTDNWLPEYKLEDFNTQIPQLKEMLLKEGISKVRRARVIPIQAQLQIKPKTERKEGSILQSSISKINIATKEQEFLNPIALIPEETNDKALNESIEQSYTLLNNLISQLDKTEPETVKYNVLKKRVARLNKSISNIIIKQDFSNINTEFKNIINKYTDKFGTLVDVDNKKTNVNGEEVNNYNYLSLEQILDLVDDVKVFKSIANSSIEHFKGLSVMDEESLQSAINDVNKYVATADRMLKNLEHKVLERSLTESEIERSKDDVKLGFYDKMFSRFSEIPNTIIQKARQHITAANNKSRLNFQQFENKLKKVAGALDDWGASRGLNPFEVYKQLVNQETWNLHNPLKKELYGRLEEAKDKKDDKTIDSIYSLKKNSEEIFKRKQESYKFRNNVTDEANDKDYQFWLSQNDPKVLKYTNKAYKYYEIDYSKLNDSDFTSEYLNIKQNKPLLDYYNFWTESMVEFRDMYEFKNSYQVIPNNFVPWIKKSMIEAYYSNGVFNDKSMNQILNDYLKIQQEEKEIDISSSYTTIKGQIDPDTGKAKREIPKMFVNPLRNASGEIDGTLKSFDLNASLLTFAYGAFNYNAMKEIEVNVMALQDVMQNPEYKIAQRTKDGNKIQYAYSKVEAKMFGRALDEVDVFNKLVDYHMYGVKLQEVGKLSQALLKTARYQQLKELGLSPLTASVAALGARSNAFFEGIKGYYYTKSQFRKALKARAGNEEQRKLYFGLSKFFQPYQGKPVNEVSRDAKTTTKKFKKLTGGILKDVSSDTLLAWFRQGDEHIEEQVLYSMLQNYGVVDGKLTRIGNKPDIKSLLDNTSIVDGELVIKDILDKEGNVDEALYNEFRQLVLNITSSIKGSMNEEDMNIVNMHIAGNLFMRFKNWMPGLIKERFEGVFDKNALKYNYVTNNITISRYAALKSELNLNEEQQTISDMFFKIFSPSLLQFGGQIFTFGQYKMKVNQDRAKVEYLDFLHKNRNNDLLKSYSFEDFLDYKQGQINALATEIRFIVMILAALSMLGGDWDDDEEADYKSSWVGRQSYRILNRYRRELMSLINPDDWRQTLLRNSIPLSSLAWEFMDWIDNTFDEARDTITGKDYKGALIWKLDKNDRTEIFSKSFRFIPAHKAVSVIFEPFEADKKKEI
jgi:hypothetical protein